MTETKCPLKAQNDCQTGTGGDRTLRHFFDDWPRSADNAARSATNLSIATSDFSLKLGTSNGDDSSSDGGERGRPQLNWGMAWETSRAAPMGGPLAEALRSSVSTSSPTSVLHQLQRSSASETSYVSS